MKQLIAHCSYNQIVRMFARFYPAATVKLADEFAECIQTISKDSHALSLSAAQLQGYFMFHKNSAQDALDNINTIHTLV